MQNTDINQFLRVFVKDKLNSTQEIIILLMTTLTTTYFLQV